MYETIQSFRLHEISFHMKDFVPDFVLNPKSSGLCRVMVMIIVSLFKVVNVGSGCPISRARGERLALR